MGPSVVVLSGVRGDTRRYRTLHVFEQLRLAGVVCYCTHVTDPAIEDIVKKADVVILHRVPFDRLIERLFRVVRSSGKLILFDADDLTFDLKAFRWIDSPDFQDPIRAQLYQEDLRRNRQTLELCDGVLTSTDYLAEQVRLLGKPVWIHRNGFSLEMLALADQAYSRVRDDRQKVVIGYASGTPTHDRDFEIAKPAVLAILDRYSNVYLDLIGPINPGQDLARFGERVRRIPLLPWRDLPLHLARFDVNLAPLVIDNPFAQSKSEIKYVEAGLVGVPTVASPTSAFTCAIRSGDNGFIATNAQDWEASIDTLIRDHSLREGIGKQAYTDVRTSYHPYVRARQIVNTLNQIAELFQLELNRFRIVIPILNMDEKRTASLVSPDMEKHPTLTEMAHYTFRNRGIFTLIKQEWIFMRRLLAPIFPYQRRDGKKESI